MPKVVFSLNNYNKFVEFIGKDWVEEEYQKYLQTPSTITHPFIQTHSKVMSSSKHATVKDNLFLPKEIYLNMQLFPFKKYDLLGMFIENISTLIQSPTKFQMRLQNKREFQGAVFELFAICILLNNGYEITRIKEEESKTPDLYIKMGTNEFTVEVTVKNEPDNLHEEEISSRPLIEKVSKLLHDKKISTQLGISSNYSFKEYSETLFNLCEEVIINRKLGWNIFCDNNINIIFNKISSSWDDSFSSEELINNNSLLSLMPFNLGSNLEYLTNTNKKIKNVTEVAANYFVDITKSIKSTIVNKIEKEQVVEGVSSSIFVFVPHNILMNYDIDNMVLKAEIEKIISTSEIFETVFIIIEYFGKRNDIWEFNFDIIKINNPNKPEEALLNIAPFETEVYTVNDSES